MRPPRSLGRRFHLAVTALLAASLAAVLFLLAAGVLQVRPAARRADAADAPPGRGPRVERVGEAEKYFTMAGQRAHCFRYDGGPVDCWIEVTAGGRRTVLGADLGSNLRAAAVSRGERPGAGASGYILWVRREEGGAEVWDLVITTAPGADGGRVGSSLRGVRPPAPDGPVRGGGEAVEVSLAGPLADGQEIDLYSVMSFGDADGAVARTAVLRCRAGGVER